MTLEMWVLMRNCLLLYKLQRLSLLPERQFRTSWLIEKLTKTLFLDKLGLVPVWYRSCFAATYLKSLIRDRVFGPEIKQVSDLTDEIIKGKLQEIADSSRSVSVESSFADVKRNVKLDANGPDAGLRILMLSAS